jgi:myo-inositol-1(or 4)-monophosphatase
VAEELGTGAARAASPWPAPLDGLLGVGRILAGVVHDPWHEETYAAVLGAGATLNGVPLRVDDGPLELGEALVATGFGYGAQARRAQAGLLATVLPAVRDLRRAGAASLDACFVAAGRLDGYYEAEVHAWDVAAALLVAGEAGATCAALDGLPPGSPTVLVCRPAVAGALEQLLRQAAGS